MDDFYEKIAKYILEESSTPIDEIVFLIKNMKQEEKEEFEEVYRTIIP